jgi:hypothetical protein
MKNSKQNRGVILLFAMITWFTMFSANAGLILSMDLSNYNVDVNDSFVVNLYATTDSPADAFSGWELDVNFDNSLLNLDSWTLGGDFIAILSGIGGKVPGLPLLLPALPPALPTFLFPTVSGTNILLASFNLTATSAGTTSFFTSMPNSANGGFFGQTLLPVQYQNVSTSIRISDSVQVPEPSTLLLMLLGVAVLLSTRSRKNKIG